MPSLSALDAVDLRVLRGRLEEHEHVERAVLDEEEGSIWIITPPDLNDGEIRNRVHGILSEFGITPTDVTVEFATISSPGLRPRVRFAGADRTANRDGVVRITAHLDWQGERFSGSAEGESGALIELRTAGQATLKAVEALTKDEIKLRLIGVKQSAPSTLSSSSLPWCAPRGRCSDSSVPSSPRPIRPGRPAWPC